MSDVLTNQGLEQYQMEPYTCEDLDLFNVGISIVLWIGLGHVENRNTNY